MDEKLRIVVSGGGTGGHIYPALALVDYIKKCNPDTESRPSIPMRKSCLSARSDAWKWNVFRKPDMKL